MLRSNALATIAAMLGLGSPFRLMEPRPVPFFPGRHAGGRKRSRRSVGVPRQRLAPASHGGNWKGIEYLTYREHDLFTRMTRLGGAPECGVHTNIDHKQAMEIIRAQRG